MTPQQWDALRLQGTVAAERRARGRPVYKLRFRIRGRQIVRYLGTDPALAEEVRQELAQLQRPRRVERQLRRLRQEAATALRQAKAASEPLLNARGLRYHGYALRRPRGAPGESGGRPGHRMRAVFKLVPGSRTGKGEGDDDTRRRSPSQPGRPRPKRMSRSARRGPARARSPATGPTCAKPADCSGSTPTWRRSWRRRAPCRRTWVRSTAG